MILHSRALGGASLAVLAAVASLPVHAESEVVQPETIVVIGQHLATVPTVSEARAAIERTAGGVDVVGADEFAGRYAVSLRDMLGFSPGVLVQPHYAEEVRLSIRGSGIGRAFHLRGVTLLQDGVPLNRADGNGDFQELDPLAFQHIEVYRGANALRYGSSSLGGAINAVTPSGRTAKSPLTLRLEAGSFETWRGHAAYAWAGDSVDGYLAVTGVSDAGYRLQSSQSKLRFNGNVGIRLSGKAETRFYVSANRLDQEVPGPITLAQAVNTPKTAPAINIFNGTARDIRSLRLQNKTAFALDGINQLELGGFINLKSLYHPVFQILDQDSTDYGGYARLDGRAALGGMALEYVFGTNLRFGTADAKQFVNMRGKRGALTAEADQIANTIDVYGEARVYPVDAVALIGGVQFTSGRRKLDNKFNPAANDARTYNEWSPKLGVLWTPAKDIQVYANVSRAAEVPTFPEIAQTQVTGQPGFVPLETQRGWTAEFGSRGRHGRLAWDVSFYRAWLNGELLQFTPTHDGQVPASTFNAGRTIHQGVEAGLDLTLADTESFGHLLLRQIYQLNDFRFEGDSQYGDNRLPAVPKHLYRAELRYSWRDLSIAPSVEWVPQGAWADYRNTARVPGYTLLGLHATANLNARAALFLDARNLTGKKAAADVAAVVVATPSSTIYYPVEGRSVFGGMSLRF